MFPSLSSWCLFPFLSHSFLSRKQKNKKTNKHDTRKYTMKASTTKQKALMRIHGNKERWNLVECKKEKWLESWRRAKRRGEMEFLSSFAFLKWRGNSGKGSFGKQKTFHMVSVQKTSLWNRTRRDRCGMWWYNTFKIWGRLCFLIAWLPLKRGGTGLVFRVLEFF